MLTLALQIYALYIVSLPHAEAFNALPVLSIAKISQGFDFSCSSFLYAYTPQYSSILSTDTNRSSVTLTSIIDIINAAVCTSGSPCETKCKGTLAVIIYIFMGLEWYMTFKVSKLKYLPTLFYH